MKCPPECRCRTSAPSPGEQPHEVWAKEERLRVITLTVLRPETVDITIAYGRTGHGTVEEFAEAHHLREAALVLAGGRGRDYVYRDLTRSGAAKKLATYRERFEKQGFIKLGTVCW